MNRKPTIQRLAGAVAAFMLLTAAALNAPAQSEANSSISAAEAQRIIGSFTTKEAEFRRALNSYSFKRDAVIQSIGMGGQIVGEYHRVSNFTFDDQGNRYEKISYFPMPSMGEITQEDIDDLGGIEPFALEPSKIPRYNFSYVGKEKIDELNLYVFDVAPKITPDPKKTKERFFQGRIWVDDRDLQIVKVRGKGIPEDKNNKYPTFETYREQIDGRYWFPTYSYADDELTFGNGNVVRVRLLVKYTDFVVGHGKVTITEIGDAPPGSEKPEPPKLESKPNSKPQPKTPQPETSGPSEEVQPAEGGILNSKA